MTQRGSEEAKNTEKDSRFKSQKIKFLKKHGSDEKDVESVRTRLSRDDKNGRGGRDGEEKNSP